MGITDASRPLTDSASSEGAAVHLGCTIYYWGHREQSRLLVECIGPLASRLREQGLCRRLWFNRFDARGPHVYAVFTAAPDAFEELSAAVSDAVQAYLDASPSRTEMTPEALAERHAACRGKTQGVADAAPGLARNNTFYLNPHAPGGYPFALSEGMAAGDELWRLVEDMGSWALSRLDEAESGAATGPAARWLVAFERALAAAGHSPAAYWRHHAGTLALGFEDRVARGQASAGEVLARLGERNRHSLSRLWQAPPGDVGPDPGRLVALVGADPGATTEQRHRRWREIVHVLLNQLGVSVAATLPMVLFAWARAELEGDRRREDA